MIVQFDGRNYHVDDVLFDNMVISYKVHIGYQNGQRILYPFRDTQIEACKIVCKECTRDNTFLASLDHQLAIANAVMKAV